MWTDESGPCPDPRNRTNLGKSNLIGYNAPTKMSPTRTLNIAVRVLSLENTVIDLEGGIDLRNSPNLRATLFERLPATSRLVLNMSGIQYIDSSGIATLVEGLKRARDLRKNFVLFGLSRRVYDVLKLTNLLGVFQVFDTEEQALQSK